MSDLPAGWSMTELGQIASTQLGKMLSKASKTGSRPRPYLRNVNVQWGRFDLNDVAEMDILLEEEPFFSLHPGDLLVCEGGEVGRCAVWTDPTTEMYYQKALHRVRVSAGIDVRYIAYQLEHLAKSGGLAPYTTGSTIKHLPQEDLRTLPIKLAPPEEQRRILQMLEESLSLAHSAYAGIQRTLDRLAGLRASVLHAAISGRLVQQVTSEGSCSEVTARAKAARKALGGKGPVEAMADSSLPEVPESWSWVSLDEIASVVGGVTKDSRKQDDPQYVEVPYLRVANVQRGRLDLTEVTSIKVPKDKAQQLQLELGDVLFNEGGDRDKLGRGWVWSGQVEGCIHQNHVFRARLLDSGIEPKFVSWWGNTFGQAWFERHGKQTTNLASISLSTLKSLPIPLPPEAELRRIVFAVEQYLSVLDAAEASVRKAEIKGQALRSAILKAAFDGRLVPQDPSDEPATTLLEQIGPYRTQAKRARAPRKPKVGA